MNELKVLIVTQKVNQNDDVLGFFCGWLSKLAKKITKIYVLALEIKDMDLAKNIKLYSLGKENGSNRLRRFLKFNQVLIDLCLNKKIDIIFIHMCPEYAILTWPYAKLKNIPIVIWYAHKNVNYRLKLAHILVNKVVTPSKESFRIKSNKVIITGHGIDINKFNSTWDGTKLKEREGNQNTKKTILSVGRMSPIKDYETLIKAADILINKKGIENIEFNIVGNVYTKLDAKYYEKLKDMIFKFGLIEFVRFKEPITYNQISSYYKKCDIFVNLSPTGAPDKVVFEAMACRKICIVCNRTFKTIFDGYSEKLIFKEKNAFDLSEKILICLEMEKLKKTMITDRLRQMVSENHNVDILINRLVKIFNQISNENQKNS